MGGLSRKRSLHAGGSDRPVYEQVDETEESASTSALQLGAKQSSVPEDKASLRVTSPNYSASGSHVA